VAGMHSHPAKMWSEEYQVEFIRGYLDVAASKDFVVGMHVWNFADFQAVQSTNRVDGMNLKGVFTRDRKPKMAAHLLRERWSSFVSSISSNDTKVSQ
jgi:beta-glucuronidase